MPDITKLDYVAIPSQEAARSRQFYGETLGLRPDEHKNAHLALHVDDVAAARSELEGQGIEFTGDVMDTGVCHMAFFTDPDGNDLMLHSRYAPAGGG